MKYLNQKSYESFNELYKDFDRIESQLYNMCTSDDHLKKCLKELKQEVKQMMEL